MGAGREVDKHKTAIHLVAVGARVGENAGNTRSILAVSNEERDNEMQQEGWEPYRGRRGPQRRAASWECSPGTAARDSCQAGVSEKKGRGGVRRGGLTRATMIRFSRIGLFEMLATHFAADDASANVTNA
jgi:hypothetical protein